MSTDNPAEKGESRSDQVRARPESALSRLSGILCTTALYCVRNKGIESVYRPRKRYLGGLINNGYLILPAPMTFSVEARMVICAPGMTIDPSSNAKVTCFFIWQWSIVAMNRARISRCHYCLLLDFRPRKKFPPNVG